MSSKSKALTFELNAFTNIISKPAILTGPAGVPWYETLNGQDSVDMVYEYGQKVGEASIGMGYFLKRIRDKELFKELGYDTMAALAKDKFNMEETAVSRMVNLCEKYSENNNSPVLDSKYKEYNQSQLIEMLSIKDEKIIGEITPDTTVREIREIKKRASNEPTDKDIRCFFDRKLRNTITPEEFADLKKYMYEKYRNAGSAGGDLNYRGSSRGIIINNHDEITWAKFVSRVYLLEDLVPDSINKQSRNNQVKDGKEDELPGQMHIEEDFPQYCPDNSNLENSNQEKMFEKVNCDVASKVVNESDNLVTSTEEKIKEQENVIFSEKVIIEGTFRELSTEPTDTVHVQAESVDVIKTSLNNENLNKNSIDVKEPRYTEKEDVMIKYKCSRCVQQFILGQYAVIGIATGSPRCPYCRGVKLEELSRVVPGEIENLGSMSIWATKLCK